MKIALLPFWFCCFIISLPALAQTEEEDKERKPHRLTLMMANSHIPSADNVNGDKRIFIVPSWGLNYDYWISEKWAFGLHNDIVLQQYKVEDEDGDRVIERSFPISVSAVALFQPTEHWIVLAGLGREFEKTESINLICLGVEYGVELPNNWELNFNLIYENKFNVYNSWMFGVGFSKFMGGQ